MGYRSFCDQHCPRIRRLRHEQTNVHAVARAGVGAALRRGSSVALTMQKALVLFMLAAVGGCISNPEAELARLPREETSLGNIATFFAAVSSAESVTVYEGLPHPMWDKDLHTSELKRSDLIRIEGY